MLAPEEQPVKTDMNGSGSAEHKVEWVSGNERRAEGQSRQAVKRTTEREDTVGCLPAGDSKQTRPAGKLWHAGGYMSRRRALERSGKQAGRAVLGRFFCLHFLEGGSWR